MLITSVIIQRLFIWFSHLEKSKTNLWLWKHVMDCMRKNSSDIHTYGSIFFSQHIETIFDPKHSVYMNFFFFSYKISNIRETWTQLTYNIHKQKVKTRQDKGHVKKKTGRKNKWIMRGIFNLKAHFKFDKSPNNQT